MEEKLYVGNLSSAISGDDLRTLFALAGTVVWATVIIDLRTGISKGFGFVKMSRQADAQKAISLFSVYPPGEHPMVVELAQPHEERSNRLRLFWAGRTAR